MYSAAMALTLPLVTTCPAWKYVGSPQPSRGRLARDQDTR